MYTGVMAKSAAKSAIKKSIAAHSKKGVPIRPKPTKKKADRGYRP